MASTTMQHQHTAETSHRSPMDKFEAMMKVHDNDTKAQINRLEGCAGDLAKSKDQITLDTIPALNKIITRLRADNSNLQMQWGVFKASP